MNIISPSHHWSENSWWFLFSAIHHFHEDHDALSSISLGRIVIPRRNWKQWLCKIWGANKVNYENGEWLPFFSAILNKVMHANIISSLYFSFRTRTLFTSVFRLACLETRQEMRRLILHETGFTGLRFFTSYFNLSTVLLISYSTILFLNWFSARVSDSWKYVCGRRLYACIITLKFTKIQGPQFERNYIITKEKKRDGTWRVISIVAENKPHGHLKTHLHTMKVYNTHDRSFANCDFPFFPTTEVFTCYNVINAFEQ